MPAFWVAALSGTLSSRGSIRNRAASQPGLRLVRSRWCGLRNKRSVKSLVYAAARGISTGCQFHGSRSAICRAGWSAIYRAARFCGRANRVLCTPTRASFGLDCISEERFSFWSSRACDKAMRRDAASRPAVVASELCATLPRTLRTQIGRVDKPYVAKYLSGCWIYVRCLLVLFLCAIR
jgi:hypothetical protein